MVPVEWAQSLRADDDDAIWSLHPITVHLISHHGNKAVATECEQLCRLTILALMALADDSTSTHYLLH